MLFYRMRIWQTRAFLVGWMWIFSGSGLPITGRQPSIRLLYVRLISGGICPRHCPTTPSTRPCPGSRCRTRCPGCTSLTPWRKRRPGSVTAALADGHPVAGGQRGLSRAAVQAWHRPYPARCPGSRQDEAGSSWMNWSTGSSSRHRCTPSSTSCGACSCRSAMPWCWGVPGFRF